MPKYIALLRGINVSGVKLIKMEALRDMFADMGYKNVQTYIQSGNVVFETSAKDSTTIAGKIKKGLRVSLGYDVPVVVVPSTKMQDIAKTDVFTTKMGASQSVKKYITFLPVILTNPEKDTVLALSSIIDNYYVDDDVIYITVDDNKGKSLFTNTLLEKKLKTHATTRNWNTVCKLATM